MTVKKVRYAPVLLLLFALPLVGNSVSATGAKSFARFVLPPIHDAAAHGRIDEVRQILDSDPAQLQARDEDGNAAIHHAASKGWLAIVNLLLDRGCPPDIAKGKTGGFFDGWTPLHHAAAAGQTEVVKRLIIARCPANAPDAIGNTPLHMACWHNQTETAKVLLDAGANPNARREQQVTPLEMASFFGHSDLVRLLLARGADVNGRVYDGNTPLHQAAKNQHLETMQTLIEGGADIEASRKDGQTPLHIAAGAGRDEAVRYLLAMGADPTSRDADDKTPTDRAQGGSKSVLSAFLTARSETESLVAIRKAAAKGLLTKGIVETPVYRSDFTAEKPGPEWSSSPLGANTAELRTSPIPGTSRRFLGDFGNQNVRLTLSRLPAHMQVTVTMDLYVLNTWDGNGVPGSAPDIWEASVAGGVTLLRTTFYNNTNARVRKTPLQSFPQDWPLAAHPGRTGALANDSLPVGGTPSETTARRDATYRLKFTFAHDKPYLVLNFAGKNLQELADESWGIGRIEVRTAKAAVSGKRPRSR